MFATQLPGPKFVQLFSPVIEALKILGGSARPAEVREQIAEAQQIPEEERAVLLEGGGNRFDNLVAWARFYLVKAGYIDSSRRGVWALTEKGRAIPSFNHDEALELFKAVHSEFSTGQKAKDLESEDEAAASPPDETSAAATDYQTDLLETLLALPPEGFERFCQRLLRESGFQEVTVTGRSGDGGIDGIGILQVNPLVSFKVLFQCKRYKGSVNPSQVRDFRGAMMGRADKGIIITTGTFTTEAKREAVRDGVPPIELVNGEKLIAMLESLELGLVPVQTYKVDDSFFDVYR
ncbi:Mrr restriction system protein [Romeria aff. gracilis LEGE 07310]|uniref:Mrr restriction system protein n=1 Tax=Vasconcelosia minhoensis LEGE 07310 TaxID=915328 RepID=A0A8J7DNT7_9CYAN|nr:restriction endonuclease [Romeria gracilis]MBE9080211.1 Mrr restriction system protein [Romeria aff. gracilis LEGE 07310]